MAANLTRPTICVQRRKENAMQGWSEIARQKGIRYFLIAFVDLFGTMRAKIVPATAIDQVAKAGAGFAGFAAWFDMTPADPDVLVMPEADSLVQLPWKPGVAGVTGDLVMGGGSAGKKNKRGGRGGG